MKHPFLFEPAAWTARGSFFDDKGQRITASGQTTVRHSDTQWLIEGAMDIHSDPMVRYTSRYEMIPVAEDALATPWQSHNPALGTLKGSLVMVDDCILVQYLSADGMYAGSESLMMIDESTYSVRGALVRSGHRIASWAMALMRG